MGWRRALKYIAIRFMRLSATSNGVAKGVACGVTASFIPVMGVHALSAAVMASFMRANIVAAALSTLLVPPLVLPFIFTIDFWVGEKILGWTKMDIKPVINADTTISKAMLVKLEEFFIPALLGSMVLMVIIWPLTYYAAKHLLNLLHIRHKSKKAR